MNRRILFGAAILTLLAITVFLTDGHKPRRRVRWFGRRFSRRRPTKPPTGSIQVEINPAKPPQNGPESDTHDFHDDQDVDDYWRDLYENGKRPSKLSLLLPSATPVVLREERLRNITMSGSFL